MDMDQQRADFESFVTQYTGRDMEWHKAGATTGMQFAWVCYQRGADSISAEVAALRQDAARYRWLRSRFRVFGPHIDGQHGWCAMGDIGRLRGPNFDAAIDAALAAQKG